MADPIQQISEMMLTWHHRIERTAILAARLGLSIDDGVLFTRHHESAPGMKPVPVGWKIVTSDGTRLARSPKLARITDPDEALSVLEAMTTRPTPAPSLH